MKKTHPRLLNNLAGLLSSNPHASKEEARALARGLFPVTLNDAEVDSILKEVQFSPVDDEAIAEIKMQQLRAEVRALHEAVNELLRSTKTKLPKGLAKRLERTAGPDVEPVDLEEKSNGGGRGNNT